jgi:hypothetical protein
MDKKIELQATRLHLSFIRKALADLKHVQKAVVGYVNAAPLREIYRGLRSSKAHKSATEILVHTENVSRELDELERSLREGEVILTQQAQYYERQQKNTR